MRIHGEIGARPGQARSLATLAELLRAKAGREPAREVLAQAAAMFREMGMAWDLERAETALREL